jgi:uridine kinase
VATASPSDPTEATAALVAALAAERPATLGAGRLVCVDGPAGSGKTTLAAALARVTGAPVVHTDDLMDGWRGLDAVGRQLTALAEGLAAGRPATYRRYDWLHGRYAARPQVVAPGPWLVVEGVGSGAAALARWTTLLVWVEAPPALRLERGLARDGAAVADHWRQFTLDEQLLFARDGSRDRADVVVDGTGSRPPVVR